MKGEFIEGIDLSELVYHLLTKAGYDVDRQEILRHRCERGEKKFCYLVGKDVFFAVHRRFTGDTEETVGRVVAYTQDPITKEDVDELRDDMQRVGAPIGWMITTRDISIDVNHYARSSNIEITDGPGLATILFDYLVLRPTSKDGKLVLKTPDRVRINLYAEGTVD